MRSDTHVSRRCERGFLRRSLPGAIISILSQAFASESEMDAQSFVRNRSNPPNVADATGWVGEGVLVRERAIPPESANC